MGDGPPRRTILICESPGPQRWERTSWVGSPHKLRESLSLSDAMYLVLFARRRQEENGNVAWIGK